MTRVLVAVAEVGTAIQLEETLGKVGFATRWDAAQAAGPVGDVGEDVVIVDADRAGARLPAIAEAWRDHVASPGVIAIGAPAARDHAIAARITLLAAAATPATLKAAIDEAARLRFTGRMSWNVIRRALGLPPGGTGAGAAAQVIAAARAADVDIARAALRWYPAYYVTDLGGVAVLRDARALTIPEVELAAHMDGTLTLQTLVRKGPVDPPGAARLVWAMTSIGAIDLTPDVRDRATPARRELAAIRVDLQARMARLEGSTFYDVLEVTPLADYQDIERAYQAVGRRYAPAVLAAYDLGDLVSRVQPMWELVEKARSVLVDIAARGRYHDWLRAKIKELRTSWAVDPAPAKQAAEIYARAQQALGAGDIHQAMSDLAAACRHHPGHPEYESSLAWARYRLQVAAGKDRLATAVAERKLVEEMLAGTRGWPRAMLALAMLCAAAEDRESASWHVGQALAIDPTFTAARQLLARLGGRAQTSPS